MMNFTLEEKIKILNQNGFEVKEGIYEYSENEYHNKVVNHEIKVYKVYRNGVDIFKDQISYELGSNKAVDKCFENILKGKLYNILMNDFLEIPSDINFINEVCMSYRHDFGLLSEKEKELVRFECLRWIQLINSELKYK